MNSPLPRPPRHKPQGAYAITREFEKALCRYTHAPDAVAVSSCTWALRLALEWYARLRSTDTNNQLLYAGTHISVPRFTYVSVPMQVLQAGYKLIFRNEPWDGAYRLNPLPIWDSAKWFTRELFGMGLFNEGAGPKVVCLSFHATKTLGLDQGGAILHNLGADAAHWFRAMRHDGRIEGQPISNASVRMLGFHCYMSPTTAAAGLWKLASMGFNPPMPMDKYPDLLEFEVFQNLEK